MVFEFKPHVRLHAAGAEPAWGFLFLSLSLSQALPPSLSLKINKLEKKKQSVIISRIRYKPTQGSLREQLHIFIFKIFLSLQSY